MVAGIDEASVPAAKAAIRDRVRAARAAHRPESAHALLRVADAQLPELFAASVVTAYSPLPDEPDVGALVDALAARGVCILLPVIRPERRLGWAAYGAPMHEAGDETVIGTADVLLVPALAVDGDGRRLGRGGGYYDRALTFAGQQALRVAVVFESDVFSEPLPAEAHDQPMNAALTPTRVVWFSRSGGAARRP